MLKRIPADLAERQPKADALGVIGVPQCSGQDALNDMCWELCHTNGALQVQGEFIAELSFGSSDSRSDSSEILRREGQEGGTRCTVIILKFRTTKMQIKQPDVCTASETRDDYLG